MSANLALALLLAVSSALGRDPLDGVLNAPVQPGAIFQANATLANCSQPSCRAVSDIAQAFKVITRRDLPSTMVRLRQPQDDPERQADAALRPLVPTHEPLKSAYCRVLTKMARHYSAWSVGLVVVELANRVDRTGDTCTHDVLAAFPSTKDADDLISASRDACQAAGRGRCERDRRPSSGV